ncbi:hypothetical protein FGO68_gene16203 [Halteria grandinella]|uniref:Thioredoxin domain-containing protein n=1 Tax=Halteria grandinella TaxID=5974 RepID=A0A8J8NVT9_HALGN|nr:hypothetical protein FGO68_gene16203 [Halteria grandinella]
MIAREINKEIGFGHIDAKTYRHYDLNLLERDENFASTPDRFSLFMFRRGNFQDQKYYLPEVYPHEKQIESFKSFLKDTLTKVSLDIKQVILFTQQHAMKLVESEEPVLMGFVRIERLPNVPEPETVFEVINRQPEIEPRREGMELVEQVYEVVKDKIKVVAVDLNSEIGRRYAIMLGINEYEKILPQFRIIVPDKHNSNMRKYKIKITEPLTKDIIEIVNKFRNGHLKPYRVVQNQPAIPINSKFITPLNSESFLDIIDNEQHYDCLVMFYANEGCLYCEEFWPMLEQAAHQFIYPDINQNSTILPTAQKKRNILIGALNMEFNELNYIETWGSLPLFYPVLRYFHQKTKTAKDFEGVGRADLVPLMDFLVQMSERYRGDNKKPITDIVSSKNNQKESQETLKKQRKNEDL